MPDAFEQMAHQMRAGTSPVTGKQPTTEEYVKFYANSAPGALDQFRNIYYDRRRLDRIAAETKTPRDLNLRNAEHAFVTNRELKQPLWNESENVAERVPGYPFMLGAVPTYSILKWLGQKTGLGYRDSTPPSLEEVKWGLAPYWGGIPNQSNSGNMKVNW